MNIKLNRDIGQALYVQIANQIKKMVDDGEMIAGNKLPAERKLAEKLGVHRNTVIRAYDELVAEGYIIASRKKPKGYFVAENNFEDYKFGSRFFPLEKAFRYEFRIHEKKFNENYHLSGEENQISLGGMIVDQVPLTVPRMTDFADIFFARGGKENMKIFAGETFRLRQNICRILEKKKIYATPQNLQIVAETNQAIGYIATLYLREGDTVVAESPMIPDVYNIFYNRGIEVVTVSMDDDGMNTEELEFVLKVRKPKFIYTMPSFHNPTGVLTSLAKRKQILYLARKYGVPIIEDDYQNDFSYMEKEIPTLYGLDDNKMVIYINSFTLTFPYAVKVGYAVGPEDFIDLLTHAIETDETYVGNIAVFMLNDFIAGEAFDEHITKLREHYAKKLDLLCSEIDKIRDKGIRCKKPKGGLVLWCALAPDLNVRKVSSYIADENVVIMPGYLFYGDDNKREGHIRLSFSNVTDEEITEAVKRIGRALERAREENE